jgi:hypothetical protein
VDTPGADFSSTAIEILVNGEPYPATPGASAFDVVAALGLAGRPLAVEVNEAVGAPFGNWPVLPTTYTPLTALSPSPSAVVLVVKLAPPSVEMLNPPPLVPA